MPVARPKATPCRGDQLHAAGVDSEAGMSHQGTIISVKNIGRSRCTLAGYPAVRGTDGEGVWVPVPTDHGTYFDDPQGEERPATIAPGERASVIIEGAFACDPQTGPPPYDFRSVELKLPDGSWLATGIGRFTSICKPRIGPWNVPARR